MANEDDGLIHGTKIDRYRSFDRLRAAVDSEAGLSVHIDRDLVVWAVKEIQRLRVARDLTLAQFPSVLKTLAGIGDRLQEVSRDGE